MTAGVFIDGGLFGGIGVKVCIRAIQRGPKQILTRHKGIKRNTRVYVFDKEGLHSLNSCVAVRSVGKAGHEIGAIALITYNTKLLTYGHAVTGAHLNPLHTIE